MPERVNRTWRVGPYVVHEVVDHGFQEYVDTPLYRTQIDGEEDRPDSELYPSLDHALAAAIGRRWTGPRGAGGSGVGTAADWFMVMIGASDPSALPQRRDEIEDRRQAAFRAEIAERLCRDSMLRAAAAWRGSRATTKGSDELHG